MPLLEAGRAYRPFEYPWAHECWRRQQQLHWVPQAIPLGEDCRDWAERLGEHERNLLAQVFRFLVQANLEVQDCYHEKYGRVFRPAEIRMMLAAFSNAESVHVDAAAHFLDTIGMPESECDAFLSFREMRDKLDYLGTFGVDSDQDIARTLAMSGGFTEGLQLFGSFAMLMNFPRFGRMQGMGRIIGHAARDAALHVDGITRLFHTFCAERQCLTRAVRDDITDVCQKVVRLEDGFIDLVFEMGPMSGMHALEVKKYIRFVADWRLQQLGLPPIYLAGAHPFPWLQPLLSAVGEAAAVEAVAIAAGPLEVADARGDWNETWESFDRRRMARLAPVADDVANDDPGIPDFLGGAEAAE